MSRLLVNYVVNRQLKSITKRCRMQTVISGNAPKPSRMRDVYKAKFGKAPEIKAVHAGLECGIIGSTYPGLDMISFGPTIRYPHSPDEKVHIASVGKFWNFLVEALRNVPEA